MEPGSETINPSIMNTPFISRDGTMPPGYDETGFIGTLNPNISFIRNNNSAFKKNGNSLGLNFKIKDYFKSTGLKYELEIKNLGVMFLHSNIETINYDTSFTYMGLSFDQITNMTNLSSEISTSFQPNNSDSRIMNPLALNLYTCGYDNQKNLTHLNAATKYNLKNYISYHRILTDAVNIKNAHIVKTPLRIDQTNDSTQNFCEVCKHRINGFQS